MSAALEKIEKAERLLQKRKVAEAVKLIESALAGGILDEQLVYRGVDALIHAGRTPVASTLLGLQYDSAVQQHEDDKAIRYFRRLQGMQAQPPARVLAYARLLEGYNQVRDAEAAYRQAVVLLRGAPAAQRFEALKSLLRLDPNDGGTWLELASVADGLQDHATSAAAYLRAARINDDDPKLLQRAVQMLPDRGDVAAAYAQSLIRHEGAGAALEYIQKLPETLLADRDLAGARADALLADGQFEAASIVISGHLGSDEWFERGLRCLAELSRLHHAQLRRFASTLETQATTAPDRRSKWLSALDGVLSEANSEDLLGYLAEAFERAGSDEKLTRALSQSFDFAVAGQQFTRAADQLERIVELDPYWPGAADRLRVLRAHVDAVQLDRIAARLGLSVAVEPGTEPKAAAPSSKVPAPPPASSLDDLVLQAELYLQYRIPDQARERVLLIARLFPPQELNSQRVASLFAAVGIPMPQAQGAPAAAPAQTDAAARAEAAQRVMYPVVAAEQIAQAARAIHRESSASRIFFAAVNQIGRLFHADRCIAGRFNPGQGLLQSSEYCAQGVTPLSQDQLSGLFTVVHTQLQKNSSGGALVLPRSSESEHVLNWLENTGCRTVLSVPLDEAGHVMGLVLLGSQQDHTWSREETDTLSILSEQLVFSLGHARLRMLLRQFTSTDERTGFYKMSSLLDLLVAECNQVLSQRMPLSLMAVELARSSPVNLDDPRMQSWFDTVSQKVVSYLRPNDAAAWLNAGTLLVLLPDTAGAHCSVVLQKVRGVFNEFAWPDSQPLVFVAGAAEIVPPANPGERTQPEDAAQDVLYRALCGLEEARKHPGPNPLLVSGAPLVAVAAESPLKPARKTSAAQLN
jgi:tetratricopeptide (TPR) repeat protein